MPVRSFEEAEKFIQDKGPQATRAMYQWDRFYDGLIREFNGNPKGQQALFEFHEDLRKAKGNVSKLTEAWSNFASKEAVADLKLHLNRDYFDGMVFEQIMPDVRAAKPVGTQAATATPRASKAIAAIGEALGTGASSPLGLFKKYNSMEDDPRFQAVKDSLHKEWLDKREDYITQEMEKAGGPKRDDSSFEKTDWRGKKGFDQKKYDKERYEFLKNHEGGTEGILKDSSYSKDKELDLLYGSLDGSGLNLTDQAKAAFLKSLEGRRFLKRTLERYNAREAEKRSQSYKNPDSDPLVLETVNKIAEHQMARERLMYEQLPESERKNLTFQQFLTNYKQRIIEKRQEVANAEWERFKNMYEIDPKTGKPKLGKDGKPIALAKAGLPHYKEFIKTHSESFALEPDKLPTRRRFVFFRVPGTSGGSVPSESEPQEETQQQPQQTQQEQPGQQQGKNAPRQGREGRKKNRGGKLLRKIAKKVSEWVTRSVIFEVLGDIFGLIGPEGWLAILGGIIVVLFFLWLLLFLGGGPGYLHQVSCGDDLVVKSTSGRSSGSFADLNGQIIHGQTNPIYKGGPIFDLTYIPYYLLNGHYVLSATSGSSGDLAWSQGVNLTQTLCQLFGHTKENPKFNGNEDYLNPFGNLVTGHKGKDDNAKQVSIIFMFGDHSKPCSAGPFKSDGRLNVNDQHDLVNNYGQSYNYLINEGIEITIYNPDQCINLYKLQFIIAKQLGYALLTQQKSNEMYNKFLSDAYKSPFLPTADCSSLPVGDPVQKACFADMVGEYLTYPFYYDAPPSYVTPTPTITPSPAPTINPTIIAKLSITPFPSQQPGSPILNSPVSDFPTGPYKNYYIFANMNLFDQQDFYANPGRPNFWAEKITKHLRPELNGEACPNYPGDNNQFDVPYPKAPITVKLTNGTDYKVYIRPVDPKDCGGKHGIYWCTDLTIDSYALSTNNTTIIPDYLGLARDQAKFFKDGAYLFPSKYVYIPISAPDGVKRVRAGDVIFFSATPADWSQNSYYHVGIVKGFFHNSSSPISGLDSHGSGWVESYEANSWRTSGKYPVHLWKVDTSGQSDEIAAFGDYIGQ